MQKEKEVKKQKEKEERATERMIRRELAEINLLSPKASTSKLIHKNDPLSGFIC